MKKITCVLFDMDGVMLDTESQYDIFWKHQGDRYNVGIADFEKKIKGTTLPAILKKYFSQNTKEETDRIIEELDKFEEQMTYPEIPGSVKFVELLKKKGIKVGLVTSSSDTKLKGVYRDKQFHKIFDTIVSASRVAHGKPDPECYLLAAKDLNVNPDECIVFEDTYAGIDAGLAAGMTVIGLSTTYPEETLISKGVQVIPDFSDFTYEKLLSLI